MQIRVICSQPSSVGAEPGARSPAGYGQVSAGLGFAYPGHPVVLIWLRRCLFPDLPTAGNPWRGFNTNECEPSRCLAVSRRTAVTFVRIVLADPRTGGPPDGAAVNGRQLIVLADEAGHRAVPL